ncbi:MAG: sulfurtransferase TusA family protein [Reinekea sp.]|nr:sulfurtransferase TusA family protein [Reinekea sp.]
MKRTLVDARKLRCPLPLLKLKQALAQIEVGDEVGITATDAGSWRDIPAFVELTNHLLIEQQSKNDEFWFVVRKGDSD